MKTFYWVAGVFIVLIGFVFMLNGNSATLSPAMEIDKVMSYDHVKGNASSTVVLIEYADFQCPACRSYHPILKQVAQEFGGKVAIVYRHFPLTGVHQNAEFAARAAESASRQGKFWEMHDLLYEKQDEWSSKADPLTYFESYASLIGLDKAKFETDFKSKEVRDFVRAEKSYGAKIGLNSTPSFFINGKKIENPQSVEAFKLILNAALIGK